MTGPNTGVYRPTDKALYSQQQQEEQQEDQQWTSRGHLRGPFNKDWAQNTGPSHGPNQNLSSPATSGNPAVIINGNGILAFRIGRC